MALLAQPYGSRQATYDLRRLRRKGVIMRIPGTNRYQLTAFGREIPVFLTKVYGRMLTPCLALLHRGLDRMAYLSWHQIRSRSWRAY
ncbi:MAG: hypothetical protein ACRDJG_03070 [Actinomycetota bacterium]